MPQATPYQTRLRGRAAVIGRRSADKLRDESIPFNELIEGAFAVVAGSTIHVQAGPYAIGAPTDKAMTIRASGGVVVIQ